MTRLLPLLAALVACHRPDDTGDTAPAFEPHLLARPEHAALVRARRDQPVYADVWQATVARSLEALAEPDPDTWDESAYGQNACVAQAAAFVAWVDADLDAAARAAAALDTLDAGIDREPNWDLNIRLPHTVICGAAAVDLLDQAGLSDPADLARWRGVLGDIGAAAWARWVLDDTVRQITLGVSQNNHPIRTASAIGAAALANPDAPGAAERLNWAIGEVTHLYGPNGSYVAEDGAVSEGPHYYGFGVGAALGFLVFLDNALPPGATFTRDCRNRQHTPPWDAYTCVEGEVVAFENPLAQPRFQAAADWSVSQRTPTGNRPPREDSPFISPNGLPLLTHWGAPQHLVWDWLSNEDEPMGTRRSLDLTPHYLVYMDIDGDIAPPAWTHAFRTAGGEATMRSGWDRDARWLMLIAEAGAMRMTLHDHVDSTSLQAGAWGEALLIDTGYYKPNELDNAVTADAPSHSVVLIDGEGAPDKGLLLDFGDVDAFLENPVQTSHIAWAEARQTYEQTTITRGTALVRGRYFVVADRLATQADAPREHRWRLHLNAGYTAGGEAWIDAHGPGLQRDAAGLQAWVASPEGALAFEEPAYTPLRAPHVHVFDEDRGARDHTVVDGVITADAPGFLAVLAPWQVGATDGEAAPLSVQAVDAGEAAVAWRVAGVDADGAPWVDLLWLRQPGAADTLHIDGHTVQSDAAVVWLSLAGDAALLARGSTLALDDVSMGLDSAAGGVSAR